MQKTKVLLIPLALFAFFFLTLAPSMAAEKCTEKYSPGEKVFGLATGSPGELGLLKVLAEAFNVLPVIDLPPVSQSDPDLPAPLHVHDLNPSTCLSFPLLEGKHWVL